MTTHQFGVLFGCTAIVAGAWILHETYDNSGRKRPFVLNFLPG